MRRFFSDEAFFERAVRGSLLGGALLASQAMAMPGGVTWRNVAVSAVGALAGMIAAPTRPAG